MDLGVPWIDSGLELGAMTPHWSIGDDVWRLQVAFWQVWELLDWLWMSLDVTLGALGIQTWYCGQPG